MTFCSVRSPNCATLGLTRHCSARRAIEMAVLAKQASNTETKAVEIRGQEEGLIKFVRVTCIENYFCLNVPKAG